MADRQDAWTVMQLLKTSAEYLGEKISGSPRLDAELLLGNVLGVPRIKLYTEFDKPVNDAERARYRELIRRRVAGEPVAYILGAREFYAREFKVDSRVLVPRPETELIVDIALRRFARDKPWRVADFGVGSGALAVTIALEFAAASVVAVDVSSDAITVARENAERLGAGDRVDFRAGSWLDPVAGETFDWVVSNPPYLENDDPKVEPGVRNHEPRQALFAGPSGLEAIETLAAGLGAVIAEGGAWICEFGMGQLDRIADLLSAQGWQPEFHDDLAGIPRIFIATNGGG